MFRRRQKLELDETVDPMELTLGEQFASDGVRFVCVSRPVVSPHDPKYVRVVVRKFGITRRIFLPRDKKVSVARSSTSPTRP